MYEIKSSLNSFKIIQEKTKNDYSSPTFITILSSDYIVFQNITDFEIGDNINLIINSKKNIEPKNSIFQLKGNSKNVIIKSNFDIFYTEFDSLFHFQNLNRFYLHNVSIRS